MDVFYLLTVWLHILAAMIWIGGMLFLVLVLVPLMRRPEYQDRAAVLIHQVGLRFRLVGWICLGLLLLTGALNLSNLGYGWGDLWSGLLWRGTFGRTLVDKLVLVAIILLLSVLHDFYIGPRATRLLQAHPNSPRTRQWRRGATCIGRLNLLLALGVVALALILKRGGP